MKTLLTICLASLIISCSSDPTASLPDHWEYSSGKWISFKENIELAWDYDSTGIDKFEIDRKRLKLKDVDIKEIKKLIKKQNLAGLIEKETQLRKRLILYDSVMTNNPSERLDYKDTKSPIPTFGEFCVYKVRALKDSESSDPAELSVLFLNKI